jgi:hypothetical protein
MCGPSFNIRKPARMRKEGHEDNTNYDDAGGMVYM